MPGCIKEKVRDVLTAIKKCEGVSIDEYNSNIGCLYGFKDGYCVSDGGTYFYDEDCNYICLLGGFAGIRNCVHNGDTMILKHNKNIWHN